VRSVCNNLSLVRERVLDQAGDILQVGQHLRPESYDAIVSWLTVLHIPERAQLFKTVLPCIFLSLSLSRKH
jgi:hypothetical protein